MVNLGSIHQFDGLKRNDMETKIFESFKEKSISFPKVFFFHRKMFLDKKKHFSPKFPSISNDYEN